MEGIGFFLELLGAVIFADTPTAAWARAGIRHWFISEPAPQRDAVERAEHSTPLLVREARSVDDAMDRAARTVARSASQAWWGR
jgi:hypothetical protein